MPPLIALADIARFYAMGDSQIRALDGISFEIEAGEMVAIIGSSGSGKSTLLNILGCLDTPSRGRYQLDGRDVHAMSDDERAELRNRCIGFVFQSFHLLDRAPRSRTSRCRSPTAARPDASAASAPSARSPASASATVSTTARTRCPVASASAPRSPVRSSPSHRCCCATSPPATSTRRPATR